MKGSAFKSTLAVLPALFGLISAQIMPSQIVFQSATQTLALNPNYQAEWFTYSDQAGQIKMRVALTIGNVDASSWDLQGEMGYWIGVGFGTTAMAGSDIVLC